MAKVSFLPSAITGPMSLGIFLLWVGVAAFAYRETVNEGEELETTEWLAVVVLVFLLRRVS